MIGNVVKNKKLIFHPVLRVLLDISR